MSQIALLLLVLGSVPPEAGEAQRAINRRAATLCERGTSWFSRDKGCHFVISAVGASGMYTVARQVGIRALPAAAGAAAVMGAIGFTREVLQPRNPDNLVTRRFLSRRDLAWNTAGIALGILLTAAWHRR